MNSQKRRDSRGSISTSLLERVQQHDPEAWRQFVVLFTPVIYRWCRCSGLQPSDAEDIVQEVLQAVNRHVVKFHRERPQDTFRGWVWTITRNKIRDHFRTRTDREAPAGGTVAYQILHQVASEHDNSCELDDSLASESESCLIQGALELVKAEFESATWDAFWRATVDGHKASEVAEEMGMSVAGVYQAKSRVLRRVRQELAGLLD